MIEFSKLHPSGILSLICLAKTFFVSFVSFSSNVSPIQITGIISLLIKLEVFAFITSLLSLNNCLRSECPTKQKLIFSSLSILAEISPVYAPSLNWDTS